MSDGHNKPLSRDEVIEIVGPLEDDRVAAIIGTGASAEEVMEAFTWLSADEALGPDPDHQLHSRVAEVYEILSEGRFEDEEDLEP